MDIEGNLIEGMDLFNFLVLISFIKLDEEKVYRYLEE